jgi:hypothetical protein
MNAKADTLAEVATPAIPKETKGCGACQCGTKTRNL